MPQPDMNSDVPRSSWIPALSLAAVSLFALSACLQSDPSGPGIEGEKPVEDNGRLSGASSSTNWPAEIVITKNRAAWRFDTSLKIDFLDLDLPTGQDIPVRRKGTLHLFPAKVIPILDSIPSISLQFEVTESVEIPRELILHTARYSSDTVHFNVWLDLDTLQGWFLDFQIEKSTGKVIESTSSPFPEKFSILKENKFYFQGALSEVTSLLPAPAGSNPEISFYIPGTPNFCKATTDSFHLGPLPRREYPLRVARTSETAGVDGGTLVEVWELRVSSFGTTSTFTLGESVLSYQSKGGITLRNEE